MGSEEFGRELAGTRKERRLSQRALAELIGVRQTAVTQWERGATTPRNDHVFALERVLRLSPGALARYLGFGPPVDAPAVPLRPLTVIDAIESDPRLDDQQRQLLVGVYRQFIRRPRHRSAR
ncbi:MAG TPA: helix-turn-helix domain-containing protein [Actinomycetes bacterium]|jgi:transcriptional regulator with XRE-family HTH domain|nr:helix-turn-helix domain-containing protein [Actinomycetes bacterium]